MRFLHVFCSSTLLLAAACGVWAGNGGTAITVMTQNMDAGTDLGFALAYINTNPTLGIDLTYQEILHAAFAERAQLLAQQIQARKPDLVSLQEATVWATSDASLFVDQLQLLTSALGDAYRVVWRQPLTTLALPMSSGVLLGFQDSNAILARREVVTSNTRANPFTQILKIPTDQFGVIEAPDGWIAVDVTVDGKSFTFVDTHLASPIQGHPEIALLQAAQASELAQLFGGLERVVIAGDFNSNATHTPNERTQSVWIMEGAGFADSWPAVNHGNPGYTWPLYVEDPPAAHPNGPFERIDFVFERGFTVRSAERIGWKAPHASDHAGVLAVLAF